MNEKRNFDYKRLHPFKWYILENFPFLEDSIDVLTNYQLFCKLGAMYNKEIDAINTLGVQVEGITDWFDNLDVQEEVNNKLDEMAESGELAEIIAQYIQLNGVLVYDTIAEMKNATNLVNGSVARTLGYYSINDGGNATYKIRSITNDDIVDDKFIISLQDNSLVAELIFNSDLILNQIGAKANDDSFDNYEYFESAKNHGVTSIKLLKGTYYFSRIILDNGINIKGEGVLNTTIKALNSSYNNFISLNYGPVAYFKIEQLKIEGNSSNVNQTGLYIYGLPAQTGLAHGGMWYAIFDHIYVSDFTKNQIYFEGYDPQNSSLVVNQFCSFNNVYAYGNAKSEDVLKIIHQQGQFEFNNCEFDKAPSNYYNIYIDQGDCLFNQLTCQQAENGLYLSGSNIVINNIWLEGITSKIINQVDNITTYGGTTEINGGTIRNCCRTEESYGFKTSSRSILTLNNLSFRNSCTYLLFNNDNVNNDNISYNSCYFSDPIQTMYQNGFFLTSDKTGVVFINTNKTIRLSQTQNITDFTFGDKVKNIQAFSIFAHNDLTFEGSKFINPKTIARNSVCKIIRINDTMSTTFERFYILG